MKKDESLEKTELAAEQKESLPKTIRKSLMFGSLAVYAGVFLLTRVNTAVFALTWIQSCMIEMFLSAAVVGTWAVVETVLEFRYRELQKALWYIGSGILAVSIGAFLVSCIAASVGIWNHMEAFGVIIAVLLSEALMFAGWKLVGLLPIVKRWEGKE